jgi:hypothetical protein
MKMNINDFSIKMEKVRFFKNGTIKVWKGKLFICHDLAKIII